MRLENYIAALQKATDAELKRVPGMGPKLIGRLRDHDAIESGYRIGAA